MTMTKPRNSVGAYFVLSDGTGTPVTLTSSADMGDVNVSGLGGATLNEKVALERRGEFEGTVDGARKYPQITFTCFLKGEAASPPGSVQAFLIKNVPYDANVSTTPKCDYAVDFRYVSGDWDATFHDCECTDFGFSEDIGGSKITFTLLCRGTITGSLELSEV